MRVHFAVAFALLGVLALAYLTPSDDPAEIIWTSLGAGGLVYAWHVWTRRRAADQWRRQQGMNGLFGLVTQAHATLRGLGCLGQLLILLSGVGAMLNWHRLIIIGLIIGLAAVASFSAWYAERMADKQMDYYLAHPDEGRVPVSAVAQADHEAVEKAAEAAVAIAAAAELHQGEARE